MRRWKRLVPEHERQRVTKGPRSVSDTLSTVVRVVGPLRGPFVIRGSFLASLMLRDLNLWSDV